MSTPTLDAAALSAVSSVVDKFNNKKATAISEFTTLYSKHASVTPEHILASGLKGKQNAGTAFAAWYVHKSGITIDKLNITFIANNYSEIDVKSDSDAMSAELKRVSDDVKASDKRKADEEANIGVAFNTAVKSAISAIEKVRDVLIVPSNPNSVAIMSLMAEAELLRDKYRAVVKAAEPATEKVPASK
mgnify:FL=1